MRMLSSVLMLTIGAPATAQVVFLDGFEPGTLTVVETPALVVQPGNAATRCYHFRAPDTPRAVRRIVSSADANVAHLIVYATYDNAGLPTETAPPGTVSDCTAARAASTGWLHVAHDPVAETVLPSDDGNDGRLAFSLGANQPLVIQVRLPAGSQTSVSGAAAVTFEYWNSALPVTPTASYVLNNVLIQIPPDTAAHTVSATCPVPQNVHFWRFTTRTHRYGIATRIADGAQIIVEGTDWEHPPIAEFDTPPFYTFANNIGYRCTFQNPTNRSITFGDDEDNDETCLGVAWFFPAMRPLTCLANNGPF